MELAVVLGLSGAVVLGLGSLTAWLLNSVGSGAAFVWTFWRERVKRNSFTIWFSDEKERLDSETQSESQRGKIRANVLTYLPAVGGLVLGTFARDWLLSPYLVGLGIALTFLAGSQRSLRSQSTITDHVRSLVILFRSRFAIGESPFSVLSDILDDLPDGAVRESVAKTCSMFRATGSVIDSLGPMKRLGNPYMARFIMLIEQTGNASTDLVLDELKQIEEGLKARERLAGQAKASLALLKGTVKFLQTANIATAAVSVIVPMWNDFFTSSLQRRGTFIAATLFMLVASVYFSQEIKAQEEQVL